MNLTSFYLRTLFAAEPFESKELDDLAKRMGVERALSPDKNDRYFITSNKNVTAANIGKKVIFGRRYYERLTQPQRMAASAHELAHILVEDHQRLKIVLVSLIGSVLLTCIAFVVSSSILLTECAFCCSFLGVMALLSSMDTERSRKQELKCDSIAVSFVSGDAMLASITLAESMIASGSEEGNGGILMIWRGSKKKVVAQKSGANSTYPTAEERALAIRNILRSD